MRRPSAQLSRQFPSLETMSKVTLNIDLGELADEPDELYALATQVNIACGGHAGDASSMRRACALARVHGDIVAAHPSYPDRAGFGRATLAIDEADLRASLAEQCRSLREIAAAESTVISRVKPHGALYHDVARDDVLADCLVRAALETLGAPGNAPTLVFVGALGGALERAVTRLRAGSVVAEAFADRTYDGDRLRPRSQEGALIDDPERAAMQALSLARSGRFGTLCVHGDTPGAVAVARRVRLVLEAEGLLC
jgi:5-oxoprolinase (ATP-hydrolysing) subunit A